MDVMRGRDQSSVATKCSLLKIQSLPAEHSIEVYSSSVLITRKAGLSFLVAGHKEHRLSCWPQGTQAHNFFELATRSAGAPFLGHK